MESKTDQNTLNGSIAKVYIKDVNKAIKNLLSNGFEEYLNTWEKETVDGDLNLNHVVFTCTKGYYSGQVADIYYNENDGRKWIQFSKQ
jgi:hypothetical protein